MATEEKVIFVPLAERTDTTVITLDAASYSADEEDVITFVIQRGGFDLNQVFTVDWAFSGVSVLLASGTVTFYAGSEQSTVAVVTGTVGTDQTGTLTISNPQYVSGPISNFIWGLYRQVPVTIYNIPVTPAPDEVALRALGYLLPEDYGAIGDGSDANATANITAIRAAQLEGYNTQKTVYLQGDKEYAINGPIYEFGYAKDNGNPEQFGNCLIGGGGPGTGKAKPIIRLVDGANNYGNPAAPRPLICWRWMRNTASTPGAWPSDPLDQSSPYEGQAANLFKSTFGNIHFDCGNNPGAFGVYFPAAQECFAYQISIDCSQALGGWWGLLGRQSPMMDIEVTGGVWQIKNDTSTRTSEGGAGCIITGLTLNGDSRTTTPIATDDFVPLTIVGFNITQTNANSIITSGGYSQFGTGSYALIDGRINTGGGVAINNTVDKTIYIRNVWVTGASTLIRDSGGDINGSGTWSRINEYCCNEQGTRTYDDGPRTMWSLLNGNRSQTRRPVLSVTTNSGSPAIDHVAKHSKQIPGVDNGPYINIDDKGAQGESGVTRDVLFNGTQNTALDSRAAIQAAIDEAETVGHNRVFIPRGAYYVGSPGIRLKPDTVFIGTGVCRSVIATHGNWNPTSQVYVLTSANDADGAAHSSNVSVATEIQKGSGDPYPYDWFSWVLWQTGRNSSSVFQHLEKQFEPPATLTNLKVYYSFANNAGGKHYSLTSAQGRQFGGDPGNRGVLVSGTSEPLFLYGLNLEAPKDTAGAMDTNAEVVNSQNVRMYGSKREGEARTLIITDSQNIAWYGLGRQTVSWFNELIVVDGASDNILLAPVITDNNADIATGANPKLIYHNITGQTSAQLDYPDEMCSIYKYGQLDDTFLNLIVVRTDGFGDFIKVQDALNAASPGTTIELQANTVGGTQYFNEGLTLPTNGQEGQEITLRARDGDTIVLYSTAAPRDIITPSNNSYWEFDGLQFGRDETLNGWSYATGRTNVEHDQIWAGADDFGSHHIVFRNCRFYGGSGYHNIYLRSGVHHIAFINCIGSHVGLPDDANLVTTDNGPANILYKNCTSFFIGHSGWQMTGPWHVAKNCITDGDWTSYQAGAYYRAFTSEGSKASSVGRNLIDGCIARNSGQAPDGDYVTMAKCFSYGAIVRRNYFFDSYQTEAIGNSPVDPLAASTDYWRIYNNSIYNCGAVFDSTDAGIGALGNEHFLETRFSNNLCWEINEGIILDNADVHFRWRRANSTKRVGDENDWRGSTFTNNVFHTTLNDFRVKMTNDGGDVTTNLADAEATWPNQWYDNSAIMPSVSGVSNRTSWNYDTITNSFVLSDSSEGRGEAEHQTLTNGTGDNSTTLIVDDAGYFYAGADPNTWDLGYFGEEGDYIQVGMNPPVQINAINYTTNTITLATAITWSDGEKVWLCDDDGAAAIYNIGANQTWTRNLGTTWAAEIDFETDLQPQRTNPEGMGYKTLQAVGDIRTVTGITKGATTTVYFTGADLTQGTANVRGVTFRNVAGMTNLNDFLWRAKSINNSTNPKSFVLWADHLPGETNRNATIGTVQVNSSTWNNFVNDGNAYFETWEQKEFLNGASVAEMTSLDTKIVQTDTWGPDTITPRAGSSFFRSVIYFDKDYAVFSGQLTNKPRWTGYNIPPANANNLNGGVGYEYDTEVWLAVSFYLPTNYWDETGQTGDLSSNQIIDISEDAGDSGNGFFYISIVVPDGKANVGGIPGTTSKWIGNLRFSDWGASGSTVTEEFIDLGVCSADLGMWTDFVIRYRINPFTTTNQGQYGSTVNPKVDLGIGDAIDAEYELDKGIFQLWKSTGPYLDSNKNRRMELLVDRTNTGIGSVPRANYRVDTSIRQYKYAWHHWPTASTDPIYVGYDCYRSGRAIDGVRFSDVHPTQQRMP